MRIVKAKYRIITHIDAEAFIFEMERFGRVSHLSEPKTNDPKERFKEACSFIKKWGIEAKHETILEAKDITVEFIVDTGVSHEGVRHRITSPMQESSRYCNYAKAKFGSNVSFIDIKPHLRNPDVSFAIWFNHMAASEKAYFAMLEAGELAEIARDVLPKSLKTNLNIKANIREWRDIFRKRTALAAHPQMREVMRPLLEELKTKIPVVFDDIQY
jgi:thymidylate synthase (FAD)